MNDTKQNTENSPLNAAKTLNSELADNHPRKLEKALVAAFVPYMGNIQTDKMALIEGQYCLINTTKGQIELFQSIANEMQSYEEIPIRAGSLVGFTDGLINQLNALDALTGALSDQIFELSKERDIALEAVQFVKKGGEK